MKNLSLLPSVLAVVLFSFVAASASGLASVNFASAPDAGATPVAHASGVTPPAREECGYWFFVVTYSENDSRVTNAFHACGDTIQVYEKVRRALGGFKGFIQGNGTYETREKAEARRREIAPNLKTVRVPDRL